MSREAQVRFCESRAVRSRPATHLVVMVHGSQADTEAIREDVAQVLAPMGLVLSQAKTRVVHMSDGFDFLGFHIRWKRKRGSNKWHVYTFIADRPIRSVKAKIRALTHRKSQQDPRSVVIRLNMIMRGWASYFKHAVAKFVFNSVSNFVWNRVVRMIRYRHRWRWKDVRDWLTDPTGRRWQQVVVDGIELFDMAKVPIVRYRHRGTKIPNPWTLPNQA